jgi:hypothetical protein
LSAFHDFRRFGRRRMGSKSRESKANSDIEDRSDRSDCLPPSFSSNVAMSNGF